MKIPTEGYYYELDVICETNSVKLVVIDKTVLGDSTFKIESIIIIPNPIIDSFEIIIPEYLTPVNKITLDLYSITGNHVNTIPIIAPSTIIKRNGLSSGTYLATITIDEKIVKTIKVFLR